MENDQGNNMPNSQLPRKSPQSEQLVQGMLEENRRFRRERSEKVALAKQNIPDKQPFNIESFATLYNLRDDDGKLRITTEVVEDYEAEYYLKNPDIKSLQEFAEQRRKLDEQAAG